MGNIRKIDNDYFIEFYARGLKYQQKIGPEKKQAEIALKNIEDKITKGEMALIVRDVDVDIFLVDFLECAQKNHTAKTFKRYESLISHFKTFLKSDNPSLVKLSQLTPRILEQYRSFLVTSKGNKEKRLKPKAVNITLFLLRDIFDYAIKLGYLNDNPVLHIRFVKILHTSRIHLTTQEEFNLLFNEAPADVAAIIETIFLTGMHVEELIDLKWSDIDWQKNIIGVPPKEKGSQKTVFHTLARDIPMQQKVSNILQKLKMTNVNSQFIFTDPSGKQLNPITLKDKLKDLTKNCGFKKMISFYTLRHTFAVNLIKKGVSLVTLQKILGHDDFAMTMMYATFVSEDIIKEGFRV